VDDRIDAERETGVVGQERIGHCPGKPAATALQVKTQEMVAVAFSFGDPQFADRTAMRERVLHQKPPALNSRINRYVAMQYTSDNGDANKTSLSSF
jgi:hypothetical protein